MRTSVPQTKPPRGGGWRQWCNAIHETPYDYVEVETWREGWTETGLQEPEANPMQNVYGLWWRPAGPKRSPEERFARALAWWLTAR